MKEKRSGLFAIIIIIIVLALGLFLAFSGRIFDWLSARYISSSNGSILIPEVSSSTAAYFDAAILEDKQLQALKDYSTGFDFDTIGQKTMAPVQNIVDKEGNIIGQKVPAKTYLGNNRPF